MARSSFRFMIWGFGAVAAIVLTLVPPLSAQAHGDESHVAPDPETVPADDFILSDAMRLIAADFGTLRTQGGNLSAPKTSEKVLHATQNAQRYMRTVKRRWAPDRGFRQHADAFLREWQAAEAAVRAGDSAGALATVSKIGGACKACHEIYRDDDD